MDSKIKYRPDIDGLRGIAVLLVVFYHFEKIFLETKVFQGGFVGVDIFFVISGYLISTLLFRELKISKKISFYDFYVRRIKRILPVLSVVIIFILITTYLIFIPEKYTITVKSAVSSWFFFSNLFFWKKLSTYHAEESVNIPLLHTWSLSVEEQFYILFPIFLFLIFKYFKNKLLISIFCTTVLSLILSTYASFNYPSANFYFLPTRVWEILFGSIIAYFEIFKNRKFTLNKFKVFLTLLSLFLIILFANQANEHIFHPSIITLIPILSVSVLICYCGEKNFITNKILTSKFLVYKGLISYSLYLWHYPIFVLIKNLNIEFKSFYVVSIVILISTFLISSLSYHLIERPFRNKILNLKLILSPVIIFSFIIIFLNFKNFDYLNNSSKYSKELRSTFGQLNKKINCYKEFSEYGFCVLGKNDPNNQIDIVMLGDSVLNRIVNDLNENLSEKKYRVVNLSRGGSLYTPFGRYINPKNGKNRVNEDQDRNRTEYLEKNLKKKIIIIGAKYRQHLIDYNFIYTNDFNQNISFLKLMFFKEKIFQKGTKKALKYFEKKINKLLEKNIVILIYPFPEYDFHYIQSVHVNNLLNNNLSFKTKSLELNLKEYTDKNLAVLKLFDNLNHKNLYIIFPQNIFCNLEKCTFAKDRQPFYYDQIHLTELGAQKVNKEIISLIKEIEKK